MRHYSILSALWAAGCLVIAGASRLPLRRHTTTGQIARRDDLGRTTISSDQGFWFGNFTVGAASDLSLMIDTGSGDVILNPGLYKPSKNSRNLHATFSNGYATTSSTNAGTQNITGPIYSDTVGYAGLSAPQPVGSATGSAQIPHDGIVGFSGQSFVQFPTPNATSFFQTLCNDKVVSSCRFGLALNSDGTGTQLLGEIDSTLYAGDLSLVPTIYEWVVSSDVAVNQKIYASDATVLMDSGTPGITGPVSAVRAIFEQAGIQGVMEDGTLLGYFPCDKPPSLALGFGLPSQNVSSAASAGETIPASNKSTTFNIPSGAWAAVNNGNNNCTAVLSGIDVPQIPGLWIAGQAFFEGLYVDFNLQNQSMGFARLKSTTSSANPTASSTGSSAAATTSSSGGPIVTISSNRLLGMVMMTIAGLSSM